MFSKMKRILRISENWILRRISRILERSWRRSESGIRIDLKEIERNIVDSIHLLQVTGQCRASVNMEIDLLVP
jgi:hypothetical protein